LLSSRPDIILSELDKEDEGVIRLTPEAQAKGSSKVSRVHFWRAPINLDEDMEDVKEINGTNTQLKT
jgi:hypothetical protein